MPMGLLGPGRGRHENRLGGNLREPIRAPPDSRPSFGMHQDA